MQYLIALVSGLVLLAGCGNADTEKSASPNAPAASAPEAAEGSRPGGEDRVVQPEMDPLDRTGDTCGMTPFRRYIGEPADDIPREDLPENARIVSPSDRVTMDYSPRRLNILTDDAGTVIALKCG